MFTQCSTSNWKFKVNSALQFLMETWSIKSWEVNATLYCWKINARTVFRLTLRKYFFLIPWGTFGKCEEDGGQCVRCLSVETAWFVENNCVMKRRQTPCPLTNQILLGWYGEMTPAWSDPTSHCSSSSSLVKQELRWCLQQLLLTLLQRGNLSLLTRMKDLLNTALFALNEK